MIFGPIIRTPSVVRAWMLAAALGAICGCSTGCNEKTETGYEPRRLGMSSTRLRALYAPEFSPEAQAGATEHQSGGGGPSIRPGGH